MDATNDRALSQEIAAWLREAKNIAVLTGAGMSAESGIPTFRDAQTGLWSQFNPEQLATPAAFRADKELVWGWYVWRMALVRRAQPYAGHVALAKLAELKPGLTVITQNVDDLHERARSPEVVHLHGSLFAPRCFACGRSHPGFEPPPAAAEQPTLRLAPPRCGHCNGYIRPGVVWFGESLPQETWTRAVRCIQQCDVLLVVGTSGLVYPAASLPAKAIAAGARVVEINPVTSDLGLSVARAWRTTAGHGLTILLDLLNNASSHDR